MAVMFLITLVFNLFALFLLYLRPKLFSAKLFRPMLYNFKLSVIPLFILIGTLLAQLTLGWLNGVTKWNLFGWLSIAVMIIGLIIWLLFLPNAGYLVTELNLTHREMDQIEIPIWYDIISVLSLAISGVLNTALNIVFLQFIYIIMVDPIKIQTINTPLFWLLTWLVFPILSFGIYLGRYIRFYSWDLLHPHSFIKKLWDHFRLRENLKNGLLFTLTYGFFFALFYALTFLNPLLELFH